MKKLAIVFIGLFLMAFSFNANAQDENTATADGSSNVNIVAAITLTPDADLRFGSLQSTTSDETVQISTQGVQTTDLTDLGALYQQGTFNITGSPNAPYQVSLPANGTVTLTATGFTGDAMDVDDFVVRCSSESADGTSGTIASNGTASIEVGATLTVNENQAAGYYTGSYPVTVTYE